MSLASSQKFVSHMKGDNEFRIIVMGFSDSSELASYLKSEEYEFDLPDLIKAMAACMAELDQCCPQ